MQGKYEANQISISGVPIFKASIFVGTLRVVAKAKNEEKSDSMAQELSQKKKTKCSRTSVARIPHLEILKTLRRKLSHILEEQNH